MRPLTDLRSADWMLVTRPYCVVCVSTLLDTPGMRSSRVGADEQAVRAARATIDTTVAETPMASPLPHPTVAARPSSAPVVDPSIPTAAVSAIRQAAALNQRLADDAAKLTALLASPSSTSADLARVLRTLNANAAVGERLAPQVATWADAGALSASLGTLYLEVGTTAREGLASSLNNTAAYVGVSERMVDLLAGLGAIDAEARPLASRADLELPPLVLH